MTDKINLIGDIASALDGAYERGHPVTVGYVDSEGKPSLSLRGSVQVLNGEQIGIWARSRDSGLAAAIKSNPNVSLIFFGGVPSGAKMLLSVKGRAHADLARNDEVYNGMIENERKFDPEAKGVAIIVDVDAVAGMSPTGGFTQAR